MALDIAYAPRCPCARVVTGWDTEGFPGGYACWWQGALGFVVSGEAWLE